MPANEDVREVAVVKDAGVGNRDLGRPCLFFSTHHQNGTVALQILTGQEMLDAITQAHVYDVKDLNGKTCWVLTNGNRSHFDGWWII